MTVSQAMAADPAALAALDGPMFNKCPGQPGDDRDYTLYTCGAPKFLHKDVSRNIDIASRFPNQGITFSVDAAGQATKLSHAQVAPGAVVAVQVRITITCRHLV